MISKKKISYLQNWKSFQLVKREKQDLIEVLF